MSLSTSTSLSKQHRSRNRRNRHRYRHRHRYRKHIVLKIDTGIALGINVVIEKVEIVRRRHRPINNRFRYRYRHRRWNIVLDTTPLLKPIHFSKPTSFSKSVNEIVIVVEVDMPVEIVERRRRHRPNRYRCRHDLQKRFSHFKRASSSIASSSIASTIASVNHCISHPLHQPTIPSVIVHTIGSDTYTTKELFARIPIRSLLCRPRDCIGPGAASLKLTFFSSKVSYWTLRTTTTVVTVLTKIRRDPSPLPYHASHQPSLPYHASHHPSVNKC